MSPTTYANRKRFGFCTNCGRLATERKNGEGYTTRCERCWKRHRKRKAEMFKKARRVGER